MNEKRTNRKPLKTRELEMRPDYDFSGAVRGKYFKRYLESTNVVVLDPDIAKRFKNSASVNNALRTYLQTTKQGPDARTTRVRAKVARPG